MPYQVDYHKGLLGEYDEILNEKYLEIINILKIGAGYIKSKEEYLINKGPQFVKLFEYLESLIESNREKDSQFLKDIEDNTWTWGEVVRKYNEKVIKYIEELEGLKENLYKTLDFYWVEADNKKDLFNLLDLDIPLQYQK